MRIAVVAPSLRTLGGQAVQADELIRALRSAGHDAFLIPINPRLPGPLAMLARVKGVRTIINQIAYAGCLFARIPRAEVVHVFSASYFSFVLAPVPALVVAKLFRRRAVLNYHSGEAEDHLRRSGRLVRFFLRMADALVVPSPYLGRVFGEFGSPATVIPNIVDLDRFAFRERLPLQPRFVSTRNLEPLYDVANTLRAFALVQRKYPEATLDVVGSGSQLGALRDLAAELKVSGVRFSGRIEREELPRHCDEADLFLNSSRIDNQPVSILEAFAAGLPIVTTDAGGIPDLVQDGRTGLLVRQGSPEAMAEGILGLLERPERAIEFARNARAKCGDYARERVVEAFEGVYRGDVPAAAWVDGGKP